MTRELNVIYQLWKREILKFTRQIGRIIGSIGQPLLLWILLGSGIGSTFQMKNNPDHIGFMEYFFPGILLMILLFTVIFSTISIIEDRQEGLLRTVLIAPVSRSSIVMGLTAGGITVALVQGILLIGLIPFMDLSLSVPRFFYLVGIMLLISFGISCLGFFMAWLFETTQAYHGVMNFLLIPMWLLSGAVFPVQDLPNWLSMIMKLNPVTYGLEALRASFYPNLTLPPGLQHQSLAVNISVFVVFTIIMFGLSLCMCHLKNQTPS